RRAYSKRISGDSRFVPRGPRIRHSRPWRRREPDPTSNIGWKTTESPPGPRIVSSSVSLTTEPPRLRSATGLEPWRLGAGGRRPPLPGTWEEGYAGPVWWSTFDSRLSGPPVRARGQEW